MRLHDFPAQRQADAQIAELPRRPAIYLIEVVESG
jgi:hypothetical protein